MRVETTSNTRGRRLILTIISLLALASVPLLSAETGQSAGEREPRWQVSQRSKLNWSRPMSGRGVDACLR